MDPGSGPAINVATIVRADRFYDVGYTGTNAKVATIEGGTPWRGHESLDWILASNLFTPAEGLPIEDTITSHATSVSHVLAGKAPAGAADPVFHQGIAHGILPGNFFAGNIATAIDGNNFSITTTDLRNIYHEALVTGVGGNPANRVDVVNSSWSGATTGFNLNLGSKLLDAVVFEANQTRGSTVVFSAGNDGPSSNLIGRPVSGFNVIAVGALGEYATDPAGTVTYNTIAAFSDRGPITYLQPLTADATTGTAHIGVRPRVDIAAPGLDLTLADYNSSDPDPQRSRSWSGTSFASPIVAGGIALLADYAHTLGDPFATDGRVIRSVLINSADKTAGWSNGQSWNGSTWTTTQGLDYSTGGGRLNLDQAFRQYVNEAGSVTQLLNPSVTAPLTVSATGWARATLDRPIAANTVQADFVTDTSLAKYTEFNATLTWFVNGTSAADGSANAIGFHNLDLEIWRADAAGSPVAMVGKSTAAFNNVEHLSFLLPTEGRYLVRVTRPGGTDGTYYSFAGDTTSDVFGLAWMARPSLLATSGASTAGGNESQSNVLVAPDAGQTASLTIDTRLNVLNRVLIGGSDYGSGGAGSLTVPTNAVLDVSNQIRVFSGSSLAVTGGKLTGGVLTLESGSDFQLAGPATLLLSRIETSAAIRVANGASAMVHSFTDSQGNNSGRLHLASAAATFEVAGQITIQPIITGANGLTKNGSGTLILAPTANGRNQYTGMTQVNAGTLALGSAGGIPTNGNVTVAAGATFNLGSISNTRAATIGTLLLDGGTFRVPTGSGNYHLRTLAFQGGTADFTGSTEFTLHFVAAGTAIRSLASDATATWIGSGTSRVVNDFTSGLAIDIAAGTTASGIDLDAGVIFSGAGTSGNFYKTGAGTLRLTNVANTAHFDVQAGRLRVDEIAALGTGNISLNGGTLTYGGTTTTTAKPLTLNAGGGTIEVLQATTHLTLNGTDQIAFGSNAFTKAGPGTLTLAGSNSGSADSVTHINAGRLRIAANMALPAGSTLQVHAGGTLELAANPTASVFVDLGGTLHGDGGLASGSDLTIAGTISPGSSAGLRGRLTVAGHVALNAGGTYIWDVAALPSAGTAGTHWDMLDVVGSLGGSANAANPFTLQIVATALTPDFTHSVWTIAHVDGTISLDASAFAVTTEGWSGPGSFEVLVNGGNLQIRYASVPEPRLLGLAVVVVGGLVRRRQSKITVLRS